MYIYIHKYIHMDTMYGPCKRVTRLRTRSFEDGSYGCFHTLGVLPLKAAKGSVKEANRYMAVTVNFGSCYLGSTSGPLIL